MLQKYILLFFLILSVLVGGENDIQSQIAKLQTLPKNERFKLMNEIKRQLAKMNAQQRKQAIGKLRASMQGRYNGKNMQHRYGMHQEENQHQKNGLGEHIRQNMQNNPSQQLHNQPMKRGGQHDISPQKKQKNPNMQQHRK
jgi:hypothetical protein